MPDLLSLAVELLPLAPGAPVAEVSTAPAYLVLTPLQVAAAASLILVSGAVSVALRLGMERTLLVAAGRAIAQLFLLGLVLEWVFRSDAWYLVVALLLVMTTVAGWTAARRSRRRYRRQWLDSLVSIGASAWLVTAVGLYGIIGGLDPWYRPQYVIPFLGMVLGNTLNGISIGLDAFTDIVARERALIETRLALGATGWEAARDPVRRAVRTGMLPITNTMMVVGIVSLPGMMTGQILAGTDPIQAVTYQIAILFLIAAATALGTLSVVLLGFRRLLGRDHRLRPPRGGR